MDNNILELAEKEITSANGNLRNVMRTDADIINEIGKQLGLKPAENRSVFNVLDPTILPSEHRQRPMTMEECKRMIGENAMVKMNFIPQMIGGLVMHEASLLVNYCCEHKVKDLRKHTRAIRTAVEEYSEKLAEAYGLKAFKSYMYYYDRYMEEIAGSVWLMELQADTLAHNQLPDCKHWEIAVRVLIIVRLETYIRQYEIEVNKLLTSKFGEPVTQAPDVYHQAINACCHSIAKDMGFKVDPDKHMGTWVQVLSNKAWKLAETLMEEEAKNSGNIA